MASADQDLIDSGAAAPSDATADACRVRVLLPLPLGDAYDYLAPDGVHLQPGDYVRVPLGRRVLSGVVWDGDPDGSLPIERLKPVLSRHDAPPMPESHRRFVAWVAAYCCAAPGAVLKMALPVPDALDPARPALVYRPAEPMPDLRPTPARQAVLARAAERPDTAAGLARAAGCSPAVVRGLADAGALVGAFAPEILDVPAPDLARPGPSFSSDQAAAVEELRAAVAADGYAAILLDGVTGSGKTEVYFEAVAAALAAGRQVLVLLPEIALSPQWLDRFERRFGARPLEWHSDLGDAARRFAWRAVATGAARIVVGARSALFLPFPELGLIVVDEEHEAAYKQEDGVIYGARDMAVARAHQGGFPVVLVSATPSLETMANAEAGRYARLALPARHGGATLPEVTLVDLRRDRPPRQRFLSPGLRAAIAETLAEGEQALLFLNRRGYAPLTLCRACGHRFHCPNCTAWLVEHKAGARLSCHHCGHGQPLPTVCPSCGATEGFAACGPGVERVAEEVAELYGAARVAVATSDSLTGPKAMAELVRQVAAHEIDILIGTQVLAKGHHFPMLTLIGVVDADLGLSGGDLRAAERTFQLLHQVAGRAGRAERPGRVFLQTHMPEHPVMQALAADDRDAFLAAEAEERRAAGMPPFGRLAALIVSGEDEAEVDRAALALSRRAPRDKVDVWGPVPAPLALLRGRHRRRFLLRASKIQPVQKLLRDWLSGVDLPRSVRVQVDVDPYSFM